mmetsp:Transcript_6039/g.8905  ORF Transcript_6039/g.8905 Transcript_6039/m.8905 type:complete len:539 (+) Transcript_6039:29-1645(+)
MDDESLVEIHASRLPCAAEQDLRFVLKAGDVVLLSGPSGVGKTTLASALLAPVKDINITWNKKIPEYERCGALFQQSTLLDALCLAANVRLAVSRGTKNLSPQSEAKRLVEAVGLDWARDGKKMPTELSGGMARRGALALQVAMRKRIVILDEPFVGLDAQSQRAVAHELRVLRKKYGTAFLIVSHQPNLVIESFEEDDEQMSSVRTITLSPKLRQENKEKEEFQYLEEAYLFSRRFRYKLIDYGFFTLPLILLAFAAAGLAVSTLAADMLRRLDPAPQLDTLVSTQILPLVDLLLGKEASDFQKSMTKTLVRAKARQLLDTAMPPAKQAIYAAGATRLFVLELGPLLTALLLAGRIGGSYAGEISSMQATRQNDLLTTLDLSPRFWSLAPALLAGILAAPVLTIIGTALALVIARHVGSNALQNGDWFTSHFRHAAFPHLYARLKNRSLLQAFINLLTWPPIFHIIKSLTFIGLIFSSSELFARRSRLSLRAVPHVITAAVVFSSLAIIIADFAFSQLFLLHDADHELQLSTSIGSD